MAEPAQQQDESGRAQWETWKWQIELCLKEQCLFTIVDGTRQRDNARAARILGTALDEEAAIYVRKKTDAKEIWDTLLSVFEQSSLQRLYTLFDSFFEITKDDATSITKHASQLANLFDDILAKLQKGNPHATLPVSLLHHRIFKTLGPEYQYYRSTWYRVPEPEQITKLLIENLRSIENSLSSHSSGSFFAKSKSQQHTHKKQNKNSQNSSATSKKEKRACLYCKKFGHVISNCRKREAAEQNKQTDGDKTEHKQHPRGGSFFATGLAVNTDVALVDNWISDSGTTHHISANKQHFDTFEKFPIP
ncbi:uncharacterized protein LOC112905391 [Agrilus planipennis]|uniref:Uncharacterized protein LOC112905391 n=1 Tax=Agrilus planipennis TaxID=224129 RepID=A0A7F5RC25_AGRPL|nr:uncharacterized protein LOC112905391 [Agrilus planipennis]